MIDVEASKTAALLGLNRKTIDDYYNLLRKLISVQQKVAFTKLMGVVEIDEICFGSRRVRGLHPKLEGVEFCACLNPCRIKPQP